MVFIKMTDGGAIAATTTSLLTTTTVASVVSSNIKLASEQFHQAEVTLLNKAAGIIANCSNHKLNNNNNNIMQTNDNSTRSNCTLSTTSINAQYFNLTMSLIRDNVTRVLNLYFNNISDEYGYGAVTTTATTTTPTTTTPSTPISLINNYNNNNNSTSHMINDSNAFVMKLPTTIISKNELATVAATTSNRSLIGDNAMLNAVSTLLQTQLSNATTVTTATTDTTTLSTPHNISVVDNNKLPSLTFPSFGINNYENCSSLFSNYTKPQHGTYCNWTWDQFLCWPPTPVGVMARMHCPSGFHGIDTHKFASRKCETNGLWGSRPNETYNIHGWTDYQSCFKPEVFELIQKVKNLDIFLEIAQRTRVLEIVGLILSFFALIISLIIFYNFRSLRNNRTKIHKNLFFAMVLQVLVRLILYLDQAFRRGHRDALNGNPPGIENTQYVCEASYILLEYARTAMFMWMFIEGLYLHNMITVAVFQGRFPHTVFSLLGWGLPIIMTTIWALCTAIYTNSVNDCFWNYNLTPYYWILEGPRLVVIVLNFFFLMNIIRVLVMKLRQSQASDIEQTRKAVRAAIVLLPLLGITNLLHLIPALNEPWKFALWSYVTHFLTSFQGFFIALIYCFLNGEVRAVLMKSAAVYMSVRGHPDWINKRASLYSGAYNTAPDTEGQLAHDDKTNGSPNTKCHNNNNNYKTSNALSQHTPNTSHPYSHITANELPKSSGSSNQRKNITRNNYKRKSSTSNTGKRKNWMFTLCFRGPKVLGVPEAASTAVPPESVVFELSEQ